LVANLTASDVTLTEQEEPRGRSRERDIESRAQYKTGDSPTRAQQKKDLEEAKRAEQEQADYYSNHQNSLVQGIYHLSQAIIQDEGVSQSECIEKQLQVRTSIKDAPKVIREGKELLDDWAADRPIDKEHLKAYRELSMNWMANTASLGAVFVGVKGGGKALIFMAFLRRATEESMT
jgi:hypothetical protein